MQFRIIDFKNKSQIWQLISNNIYIDEDIRNSVKKIIEDVKQNGDQALIDICNKFDGANFVQPENLLLSQEEIKDAFDKTSKDVKKAMQKATDRIKIYHQKQLPEDFQFSDKKGNILGNRWQIIEKVALYVP